MLRKVRADNSEHEVFNYQFEKLQNPSPHEDGVSLHKSASRQFVDLLNTTASRYYRSTLIKSNILDFMEFVTLPNTYFSGLLLSIQRKLIESGPEVNASSKNWFKLFVKNFSKSKVRPYLKTPCHDFSLKNRSGA